MGNPNYVPKPGASQNPTGRDSENTLGIGPENFDSVFAQHTHNGTAASGGTLLGPYFIRDSAGKTYKLVVSTTGALSAVRV